MKCPNCKKSLIEQGGKYRCDDCGWFEHVEGEWHVCEAPAPGPEPEPEPEQDAPGPGPDVKLIDLPAKVVREYFGGLLTVTTMENVDNE